jgi:phage-related holin
MMNEVLRYFNKVYTAVDPLLASAVVLVQIVLFPNTAYMTSALALFVACLLDSASKYYAISVKSGGFLQAIATRQITSSKLWAGLSKKLFGYLIMILLCSLFFRINEFEMLANAINTMIYSLMFLREVQSIVENMIDAGHKEYDWLLFLIKRKKQEILEQNNLEELKDDVKEDYSDLQDSGGVVVNDEIVLETRETRNNRRMRGE